MSTRIAHSAAMLLKGASLLLFVSFLLSGCTAPAAAEPTASRPSHTPTSTTIYHVATTGDDSNDGSAANPWRTIQHAVDSIAPGDTIWVHAGTYLGARIEQSGTAEAPMTLMAAPGETAVLDGPGPNNQHDSTLELETWEGPGTVSYWIIDGLEVTGANGWGIDLRGNENDHSHHLTIRNNRVHNNGWPTSSTGIFTAFVDDVLIENNESFNNGEHGIYLSNSGDRPVVRGNRLYENANCGLHMNGDLSLGGDGTISEALIENNLIYENAVVGGCAAINMDGVTDSLVRNNLLYHNHAGGIAIYRTDGAVCSHDNRILHNTVIQAADARWAVVINDFNGDGSQCVNNKLFNNVFYSYHDWRGVIELQRPDLPGFESDHNVVMDRFTADEGNTVLTLAEWQALGYDLNSLIATPDELFVNPAGRDYHLRETSPAINLGMPLPDVPNDFEGDPRPAGGAPDSGADEWFNLDLEPAGYLPLMLNAGVISAKSQQAWAACYL